jgi:hypothetical protein
MGNSTSWILIGREGGHGGMYLGGNQGGSLVGVQW